MRLFSTHTTLFPGLGRVVIELKNLNQCLLGIPWGDSKALLAFCKILLKNTQKI